MTTFFPYIKDVIPDILMNLTIYEVFQFIFTCKEFKKEFLNQRYDNLLWFKLLVRDYPLIENLTNTQGYLYLNLLSYPQLAYRLDNGKICYNCYMYNKYCTHTLYEKDVFEFFLLQKHEIRHLHRVKLYPDDTVYLVQEVFSLLAKKYRGITNFFLQRQKMKLFYRWKKNYNRKFCVKNSIENNRLLLNTTLIKYKVKLNRQSDLCSKFISGKIKMSVEQVAVILKITSFLHSLGHKVYFDNHQRLKDKLEMLMFENRYNKSYTWMNAYNEVTKKFIF